MVLTTGCNSWEHGLDVVVEGEARHVTDQTALERAAKAFAVKWQGAWQFTVRDGRFYNEGNGGLAERGVLGDPRPGVRAREGRAVRRHHAPLLARAGRARRPTPG